MNIALVFPPFYFEPMYNMPPLGLINLATVLRGTPHRVRIFDFPLAIRQKMLPLGADIYDHAARQVLEFHPDVAAFSVQCTTYPAALQLAKCLHRQKPETKIVFGGHNASFVDERTLERFPFIDAVVRGEGEITFPELIQGLEGGKDLREIEGITFRIANRVIRNPDRPLIENLDSLPVSDYSFVSPLSVYRDACGLARSIAILEVGRGCPHRCIYCSQSLVWRRTARTYSVGRLIAEMRNLVENHSAECFLLAYDQFTARRSFAEQFCRSVIEAGLNRVPWYCISRLDTVDSELLALMREAGCESMCYGIDSGSKRTLSFIRKNIDSEILLQRVSETTEHHIVPTLSFVIGFPEEQQEDIEDTLQLALKSAAAGNANILVQMATILPGTDLYKDYSRLLTREVDTYFSLGIEFGGGRRLPSDEELIDSDPEIFSSFYNLPCPAGPLSELNDIACNFSVIASLYPRSFLLLGLEPGFSVLGLFLLFLDSIAKKTGERSLSPQSCFANFEEFVSGVLTRETHLVRAHIPELIKYESCLIRAGKHEAVPSPFHIDLDHMADFKPMLNEKIILERFTFDIPVIILDAKFGRYREFYPQEPTNLIFSRLGENLDVKQINDFGADFLRLSNGQLSLDAIAGQLFPIYGATTGRAEFERLCAEAARALAGLSAILPGPPA